MRDALQIVAGLLTPLIAIVALYIAVQQHNVQRDKLRLDLYERRLAVFNAAMNLLASVETEAVASGGAIYRFIVDTANARFLFGVEMEKYLDGLGSAVRQHRKLHVRVVEEQKEGNADTVNAEAEALERLLAQTEKVKERFRPYLGFAVRGSTETESNERVFFRLLLLVAVVSALAFAGSGLVAWRGAEKARSTGRAFSELLTKRETVCDSTPQSVLCDGERMKDYRTQMDAAYDRSFELASLSGQLFMLAWAVPLCSVLTFYAGRWVVTGKVRPLVQINA